jgi:hypothetical protein
MLSIHVRYVEVSVSKNVRRFHKFEAPVLPLMIRM